MSHLSVFGDPIEALDDYPNDGGYMEALLDTAPSPLPSAWEAWLARRPTVMEMVQYTDDPFTFVVLEYISEILGDVPLVSVGNTSVCGIAIRNGWLHLQSTTHDFVANPCTLPAHIFDALSEPRPLLAEDVKELVERVPQTWQLPHRHWTLPNQSDGLQDAAQELLSEWAGDGTRSEIELRQFVAAPSTLDTLLARWERTPGFLHTASADLIWRIAERDLRTDPEKAEFIDHLTVDGEVPRPLIAAMFSDHPAIKRWSAVDERYT